jgi:hypothetical protein
MGVVYRARDTRLGRLVGFKVLSAHLSADSYRLKRFEQEAQSAAASGGLWRGHRGSDRIAVGIEDVGLLGYVGPLVVISGEVFVFGEKVCFDDKVAEFSE